jgi:hypothetical protein
VLRGVFVKYYDRVATVRLRKIFLSTARPCERGARRGGRPRPQMRAQCIVPACVEQAWSYAYVISHTQSRAGETLLVQSSASRSP